MAGNRGWVDDHVRTPDWPEVKARWALLDTGRLLLGASCCFLLLEWLLR